MLKTGIQAAYPKPKTSRRGRGPGNKVFAYLLSGLDISAANAVWAADITYIPMARGFCYLAAIMDGASRRILAWRLSNTLDARFCVAALEEALACFGTPAIFNTDQGAQFTADAFTSVLQAAGVRISMDGRGAWSDNVFTLRFWWTLKHEEVCLLAYDSVWHARRSISASLDYYNEGHSYSSLQDRTRKEAYDQYSPAALPLLASQPPAQAQVMNLCQDLRTMRNWPTGGHHRYLRGSTKSIESPYGRQAPSRHRAMMERSTMAQPRLFPSPQAPDMNGAAPILKWAGGKGQLLPTLRKRFPIGLQTRQIQVYAEPFVGGGAVYFDLVQQFPTIERAFLFDVNPELVNLYTVLQQEVDDLADQLADLRDQYLPLDDDGRKAFYYRLRDEYNAQQVALSASGMNTTRIYRAAQTVFLNRTCFNGLFRVNARGAFNVPFGRNGNPSILDEKRLRASSAALELAEIRQADFSEVSTQVGKDSFVYYDPPYRPISSTSSFNSYMKGAFNDNEQIRLASHFHTLDQRGVKQLLSNSDPTNHGDDPFFDELYRGFTIERVKASRMINSKASKRGAVRELLVRNYEA